MARRGCGEDGRRMSTAWFVRTLQSCTGCLYMGFRFIFQVVRPIGKTRNQLSLLMVSAHGYCGGLVDPMLFGSLRDRHLFVLAPAYDVRREHGDAGGNF